MKSEGDIKAEMTLVTLAARGETDKKAIRALQARHKLLAQCLMLSQCGYTEPYLCTALSKCQNRLKEYKALRSAISKERDKKARGEYLEDLACRYNQDALKLQIKAINYVLNR